LGIVLCFVDTLAFLRWFGYLVFPGVCVAWFLYNMYYGVFWRAVGFRVICLVFGVLLVVFCWWFCSFGYFGILGGFSNIE